VEWSASDDPKVDWLIEGVIQRDANGIIAAEPKAGKSLCGLDLLISLACGTSWLGRPIPHPVRTAYISREDSPLLTKVRIAGFLRHKGIARDGCLMDAVTRTLIDVSGRLWCNTREQLSNFDIDNDEHLANMAHDLKERGVEFAILDVFNRLHKRSENDNTEMAQVVQRISQMGQEAGCSIGVIHHISKENNSGRFFTRIRGASAIHGWTEWSIGLSLENPNSEGLKLLRKAEFETKAGQEAKPIHFTVEFDNGRLWLQPTDMVRPAATTQQPPSENPWWQN
jgi:RecA-family ATPase